MKKAAVFGPSQGGVVDAPKPKAAENWVVVKIHAAPMCTEFKTYVSGGDAPYLGHEAAGEVVEVAQPCRVKVGDRVVVMPQTPCGQCELCLDGEYIHCQDTVTAPPQPGGEEGRATMAQFMLKQDWVLAPIPDDISYDHASMACCGLGPTFRRGAESEARRGRHTVDHRSGPGGAGRRGQRHASRGQGTRGRNQQLPGRKGAGVGRHRGDRPDRPGRVCKGRWRSPGTAAGVDHSIDCSGVVAAHRFCIDATRRKGTVSFVGESGQNETPVRVSADLLRKGLSLHGSWHYNMADTPQILRVIAANSGKLDKLISHRFPLARVADAWALQATGACAKVLLKPWEQESFTR